MLLQTAQVKPAVIDPKLALMVLVKKKLLRLQAAIISRSSLNFANLNSFLLKIPRAIFLYVVLDNIDTCYKLDA